MSKLIRPRQRSVEVERGKINASNCLQLDHSSFDFGGSSDSGDGAASAFERAIADNHRQVAEFNERLADEQKIQSQGPGR